MLRRTVTSLVALTSTSVPSNFVYATDMAFYFPRFQPRTHITTAGMSELSDAVAILQPDTAEKNPAAINEANALGTQTRWSTSLPPSVRVESQQERTDRLKRRDKGMMCLERGIEIFESLGGVTSANPVIPNMIRPLYAAKFEMLNGCEHMPRAEYCRHLHIQRTVLQQSAKLLYYNDTWEKSDVQQIDTACVIMAHFVKAFCTLHSRPFNQPPAPSLKKPAAATAAAAGASSLKSSGIKSKPSSYSSSSKASSAASSLPKDWSMCVGGDAHPDHVLTLPMVMERLEELQRLCGEAQARHGAAHPSLRWSVPKLQILQGLLTIPLTGHLLYAQKHMDKAAETVFASTQRTKPILDGLTERYHEPELGLYLLAQAEMAARTFDWSVAPGEVDAGIVQRFEGASEFYAAQFDTVLDADGIMSPKIASEYVFECQAYAACLTSYANFLLNAPRPQATSTRDMPVFLPRQTFTMNPITNVATSSSDMIFADVREPTALSLETCRKRTGVSLERALQINRALFPEDRQNAQAAWTLLSMACMYADTRDYLYATGLYESASKAFVHNYGATSMEEVLLQRLRYEFLAGVGSDQEAKTASHEVIHLLKGLDSLPIR